MTSCTDCVILCCNGMWKAQKDIIIIPPSAISCVMEGAWSNFCTPHNNNGKYFDGKNRTGYS